MGPATRSSAGADRRRKGGHEWCRGRCSQGTVIVTGGGIARRCPAPASACGLEGFRRGEPSAGRRRVEWSARAIVPHDGERRGMLEIVQGHEGGGRTRSRWLAGRAETCRWARDTSHASARSIASTGAVRTCPTSAGAEQRARTGDTTGGGLVSECSVLGRPTASCRGTRRRLVARTASRHTILVRHPAVTEARRRRTRRGRPAVRGRPGRGRGAGADRRRRAGLAV